MASPRVPSIFNADLRLSEDISVTATPSKQESQGKRLRRARCGLALLGPDPRILFPHMRVGH